MNEKNKTLADNQARRLIKMARKYNSGIKSFLFKINDFFKKKLTEIESRKMDNVVESCCAITDLASLIRGQNIMIENIHEINKNLKTWVEEK